MFEIDSVSFIGEFPKSGFEIQFCLTTNTITCPPFEKITIANLLEGRDSSGFEINKFKEPNNMVKSISHLFGLFKAYTEGFDQLRIRVTGSEALKISHFVLGVYCKFKASFAMRHSAPEADLAIETFEFQPNNANKRIELMSIPGQLGRIFADVVIFVDGNRHKLQFDDSDPLGKAR